MRHLVAAGLMKAEDDGRVLNPVKAKLTNEQVRCYRERYANGDVTPVRMAQELGLSLSSACRVLNGHTYRNAGGPLRS